MQLDTRIPLAVQGPQIDSPQNMLAKALQVRQLQNSLQEQERQAGQRNALAGVLGSAFDDNGRLRSGALGQIGQVAPDFVPQYANLASTQQRLDRQDTLQNTDLAMKKQAWAKQGFATSETPQQAAAYIQNGVQAGILSPEEGQRGISQIPQDPTQYAQWRNQINQSMMTAAQRAELESGRYSGVQQSTAGAYRVGKNGNVEFVIDPETGKRVMPIGADVANAGALAGAKTAATKEAEKNAERPTKAIEAKSALDSTSSSLDRMAEFAQGLIDDPAVGRITGVIGMMPNMPGGDAANAQARLNTLKSQIGFAVLQAMRDASKTGGALGAVSDTENKLLQNNIAALETVQDERQLKEQLRKIVAYAQDAKGRLSGAYEQQYGGTQPAAPQAAQPAAGVLSPQQAPQTPAGRTITRTGTLGGRKVVQYSDGTTEYAD